MKAFLKIEINGSVKIITSFLFLVNILCEIKPPIYVTKRIFILIGKIDFHFKTLIINSDVLKILNAYNFEFSNKF